MSDWKREVKSARGDAVKAAGVILGLLFSCIFAIWLLTRGLHKKPPQPTTPAAAPAPAEKPPPRTGQ